MGNEMIFSVFYRYREDSSQTNFRFWCLHALELGHHFSSVHKVQLHCQCFHSVKIRGAQEVNEFLRAIR